MSRRLDVGRRAPSRDTEAQRLASRLAAGQALLPRKARCSVAAREVGARSSRWRRCEVVGHRCLAKCRVAGVISPLLTLLTVRWQLVRTATEGKATDRHPARRAGSSIRRAGEVCTRSGHTQALWRHGRFDDEEAQEHRRARIEAQEGIIAAHGRICLRFGPQSEVAKCYAGAQPAIADIDMALRAYRAHEPFDLEREQKMLAAHQALSEARLKFLDAAHRAEFDGGWAF
jgi:hypothetical protein